LSRDKANIAFTTTILRLLSQDRFAEGLKKDHHKNVMVSPIAFLRAHESPRASEIISALLCPDDNSTCGGAGGYSPVLLKYTSKKSGCQEESGRVRSQKT